MRPVAKMVLGTAVVLVVSAAVASSQSLGEVAARTQREREAKAKAPKVFTEADLRGGRTGSVGSVSQPAAVPADGFPSAPPATDGSGAPIPGATSPATGASPVAGASPAPKVKTPDEERTEAVAAWRERLSKAQAEVSRLSTQAAAMQSTLGDSTANPYGAGRAGMLAKQAEVQRQLAAAQQSVTDLEEEGRRAGMR